METQQLPRNVRNCNPLNIRRTRDRWQGMEKEQKDKAFCQFKEMKYGWRAAFILLCRNYYHRDHLLTIRQIISKWAPASENDTQRYAATVAIWMDWHIDYALPHPASDNATWMKLALMMACYEAGIRPSSQQQRELFPMLPLVEGWMMYEEVAGKGKFGVV